MNNYNQCIDNPLHVPNTARAYTTTFHMQDVCADTAPQAYLDTTYNPNLALS